MPESNLPSLPEYAQKDGDTYMYVGSLTEEEKQQGKTAPVFGFRNLGSDADAQKLEVVDDDGRAIATIECAQPCRVAKQTDNRRNVTRIAVEPGSIIAAAFRDAANGFMEVAAVQSVAAEQGAAAYPDVQNSKPAANETRFRDPDFSGRDRAFSMYRTRILEALRDEGTNFADRYTIIGMGCGTGCTFNLLVDRGSGRVFNVPFGGEEQQRLELRHSAQSNVLDANWYEGETCVGQQVRWDGAKWQSEAKPTARSTVFCGD